MSDTRPVQAIEAELREVEFRRIALLEELREQISKSLLPNPALSFDEREYPDTAEKRVSLFEKLFVARADIYPRYWENQKTGRKGYSPACESVWEDGRRLKATEIYARYGVSKFHRLDASVIEAHLRGRIVVGTYAIRKDDTCIFLAADFDGDGWKQDAAAYRDEASRLGCQSCRTGKPRLLRTLLYQPGDSPISCWHGLKVWQHFPIRCFTKSSDSVFPPTTFRVTCILENTTLTISHCRAGAWRHSRLFCGRRIANTETSRLPTKSSFRSGQKCSLQTIALGT